MRKRLHFCHNIARKIPPEEGAIECVVLEKFGRQAYDYDSGACGQAVPKNLRTPGRPRAIIVEGTHTSLTMDIITQYSFGRSQRAWGSSNFEQVMIDGLDAGAQSPCLHAFFPVIPALMRQIPTSWAYPWSHHGCDDELSDCKFSSLLRARVWLMSLGISNPESRRFRQSIHNKRIGHSFTRCRRVLTFHQKIDRPTV